MEVHSYIITAKRLSKATDAEMQKFREKGDQIVDTVVADAETVQFECDSVTEGDMMAQSYVTLRWQPITVNQIGWWGHEVIRLE